MNIGLTQTTHLHHLPRFSITKSRNSVSLRFRRENNERKIESLISKSQSSLNRNANSPAIDTPPEISAGLAVAGRLSRLVSEFESLAEPVERVKRLLHYASKLAPYDESARSPENRVTGCSTQVWVEAEVNEAGRVQFRADSDSEISKGFCSCLVWVLDGAAAEEVLGLRTEDLGSVNVGLHGMGHSRANTWHNVLIAMQRKTRALADDYQRIGNGKVS